MLLDEADGVGEPCGAAELIREEQLVVLAAFSETCFSSGPSEADHRGIPDAA